MEKSQKMSFWQVVKRFFEPVVENKKMFFKAFLGYLWRAIGPIVSILFLERITKFLESGNKEMFLQYLILFGLFVIGYYFIRTVIIRNRSWVILSTKGTSILYDKYIKKFLRLDGTSVEKIGTGRMISICTKGFDNWTRSLTYLFHEGTATITFLFFAIYSIWVLAGFFYMIGFLILFGLVQVVMYYMNKSVLDSRTKTNDIYNENSRSLVKVIMSKFEILQSKKEKIEIEKLQGQMNECYILTKDRSLGIELMFSLPEILIYIIRIFLFLLIGIGIFNKTASFSDLVLFTGVLGLMDVAIKNASKLFKDISKDFVAVQKLRSTFDTIKTMDKYDKGTEFIFKNGNFNIKDLYFGYDDKNIFQSFDLELKGGTKTAFVGESGGGKTTLIKLLAGYIRPDNGEIEIDGQKLSEIKLTDYYKHIGYLTQDPSVFDGTIYENLVYALDTEPPKEDLEKVVKLAKCEFIRDFEKGLETEIGERGVRLSGGQKQRLAIAKIMLKNPNIILLDEPTSALDSFNEEQISIALHNLFKGKTVIVVAHRLQTVKQADKILLFEQGKILEEGTHDELVKLGGKYKKMLDLQSGF